MKSFPMQPIILASDGVVRFTQNRIVSRLPYDMNQIVRDYCEGKYTQAEMMQFAQLIGYSISGFGDLNYADKDVVRRADRKAESIPKKR